MYLLSYVSSLIKYVHLPASGSHQWRLYILCTLGAYLDIMIASLRVCVYTHERHRPMHAVYSCKANLIL